MQMRKYKEAAGKCVLAAGAAWHHITVVLQSLHPVRESGQKEVGLRLTALGFRLPNENLLLLRIYF